MDASITIPNSSQVLKKPKPCLVTIHFGSLITGLTRNPSGLCIRSMSHEPDGSIYEDDNKEADRVEFLENGTDPQYRIDLIGLIISIIGSVRYKLNSNYYAGFRASFCCLLAKSKTTKTKF